MEAFLTLLPIHLLRRPGIEAAGHHNKDRLPKPYALLSIEGIFGKRVEHFLLNADIFARVLLAERAQCRRDALYGLADAAGL